MTWTNVLTIGIILVIILLITYFYTSGANDSDNNSGEEYTLPKASVSIKALENSTSGGIGNWTEVKGQDDWNWVGFSTKQQIKPIFENSKYWNKSLGKGLTDQEFYDKYHGQILGFLKGFDLNTGALASDQGVDKDVASLIKHYVLSGKAENFGNVSVGEYLENAPGYS